MNSETITLLTSFISTSASVLNHTVVFLLLFTHERHPKTVLRLTNVEQAICRGLMCLLADHRENLAPNLPDRLHHLPNGQKVELVSLTMTYNDNTH